METDSLVVVPNHLECFYSLRHLGYYTRMQRNDLLVWMDLEMTGLNPHTDSIIEAAVILTDSELNVVAEGPDLVIHAPEEAFDTCEPIVTDMLTANGLIERSPQSDLSETEAEEELLRFLVTHIEEKSSPLCGSSIYMDRMFLNHRMKRLDTYLHHRLLDVSSIKEAVKRWHPEPYEAFKATRPGKQHRAKDDILQSIEELRFYKKTFFESL